MDTLQALLDAVPDPVLLLDRDAFIAYRNAGAQPATLACLTIAGGRVLRFAGVASEPFERVFARARAGVGSRAMVVLAAGGRAHVWRLTFGPLPQAGAGGAAAVVLVDPPPAWVPTPALSCLFGLTPAEARVLALLLQSQSPREIAAALQIATTTVRSHLKALYAKTGTRRQAELIALASEAC
ncbi:MAG TPA: LuxR C-terminal-related transcriptional regulator [Burkholderiaceae bacterium]|nr:LuxR C-terminal-related transcriptional regulator [Burkholderiaceae bacterium]